MTEDRALCELVRALGLEWPAGPDEWEGRLRAVLEPEVYAQYSEARMGFGPGPGGPAFFDFVGQHHDLAVLLQEGRLGYHKVLLPAFAEAVGAGPHGTIADLGCGCGVGTLYLAKRFPGSRVVGVERSAGLVCLADALKGRTGLANAEFVCGDYTTGEVADALFDVVVTMLAMPSFLLPFLPSERPESYRRGEALRALTADPMLPHRQVRRCLEAARFLLLPSGRAIINERMGDLSRMLLLAKLASEVHLGLRCVRVMTWESPSETRAGKHVTPLAVFEAVAAPVPFDEDTVFDLLHAPDQAPPDLSGLLPGQVALCSGPLAARTFQALGLADPLPSVRAVGRDGRRTHLHLGTSGGFAFAYTCNTHDGRELRLATAATARQVFDAAMESLRRSAAVGELASLEPPLDQFPVVLRSLLGG